MNSVKIFLRTIHHGQIISKMYYFKNVCGPRQFLLALCGPVFPLKGWAPLTYTVPALYQQLGSQHSNETVLFVSAE